MQPGFVWAECKQLWEEGLKAYLRQWWNWLDFIMLSMYLCTLSLRLVAFIQTKHPEKYGPPVSPRTEWPDADPTLVSEGVFAIANVFSFARIIYLFQANPQLGPLQISLGCMLIDIGKFFFIFFLVITSFACGLNQLYYFYSTSSSFSTRSTAISTSISPSSLNTHQHSFHFQPSSSTSQPHAYEQNIVHHWHSPISSKIHPAKSPSMNHFISNNSISALFHPFSSLSLKNFSHSEILNFSSVLKTPANLRTTKASLKTLSMLSSLPTSLIPANSWSLWNDVKPQSDTSDQSAKKISTTLSNFNFFNARKNLNQESINKTLIKNSEVDALIIKNKEITEKTTTTTIVTFHSNNMRTTLTKSLSSISPSNHHSNVKPQFENAFDP